MLKEKKQRPIGSVSFSNNIVEGMGFEPTIQLPAY